MQNNEKCFEQILLQFYMPFHLKNTRAIFLFLFVVVTEKSFEFQI